MNDQPLPQSLIQWLEAATHGLPVQRALAIRKELLGHYEDAVEDYLLLGKSAADAHQQAQNDLGDSGAVNREFNNLYHGRRRYFTALFCSFIALWLAVGLIQTIRGLGVEDLTTLSRLLHAFGQLATLALALYIMRTLRQLLNWQFNLTALDQPINFLMVCATVELGSTALLELVITTWDKTPTVLNMATVPETVLVVGRDGGFIILGLALLWMAYGLLKARVNLYGLTRFMALGAASLGLGVWVMLASTYLDVMLGRMIGFLMIMLGDVILWPTLSMLFFRAAYRAPAIALRNA